MDILLNYTGEGFDISLNPDDLNVDDGLKTAVILSMFTDARAEETDILPIGEVSRRGFWGENYGDRFGSKLWLLTREKVTEEVRRKAEDYARESLMWLVDEGIASSVTVSAIFERPSRLYIRPQIVRGQSQRWDSLWKALIASGEALTGSGASATYQPSISLDTLSGSVSFTV